MTKSKIYKILIYVILLVAGFTGGFFLGKGIDTSPVLKVDIKDKQKLPECFAGRCPESFSMDVDSDDEDETATIIPTAMTQGAGKIWIVDNGELVFESEEAMRITIEQTDEQMADGGFRIWGATEVNSNDKDYTDYLYKDGQFIPEN